MRLPFLCLAITALAGCHWIGPAQPPAPTPVEIPAKTETTSNPYADAGETGGLCGGIGGIQCKIDGDYCRMYPGDCTNVADSSGICTPKPEICTMQYDPICGCDGNTYGNACTAATQGVSMSHRGRCR